MIKMFIKFIVFIMVSAGSALAQDAVTKYFQGVNPPKAGDAVCMQHCVQNCDQDIANASFRCLANCWDRKEITKFYVCSNKQFADYVKHLQQQIQDLLEANNQHGLAINDLADNLEAKQKKLGLVKKQVKEQDQKLAQEIQEREKKIAALKLEINQMGEANKQQGLYILKLLNEAQTKNQDITKLKETIEKKDKEIKDLTKQVADMEDWLNQLLDEEATFVENVNKVTQLFQEKTHALRQVSGDFKEKIDQAKQLLQKYKGEINPYIADKGREIQETLNELREIIKNTQEFMVEVDQTMEIARNTMQEASKINSNLATKVGETK